MSRLVYYNLCLDEVLRLYCYKQNLMGSCILNLLAISDRYTNSVGAEE